MTQEFVTLPREVVEQTMKAMEDAGMQRGSTGAEFNAIESLRAALEQPQSEQPAMTPIAQRKLEDLVASGYTISGYSIYHKQKHQHGFVTGAGLVGWWRPEGMEYPQPQVEQEPVAWQGRDGYLYHFIEEPKPGDHPLYTHPQPKCEPLTDEQIGALARNVPSGYHGFAQQALYDFRAFARAIEHHHNIK